MAAEVVSAIDEGKTLRLGCLWDHPGRVTPYTAIFIWEDDKYEEHEEKGVEGSQNDMTENGGGECGIDDEGRGKQGFKAEFAFTASRPKKPTFGRHSANDLDRHVSLKVEYASPAVPAPDQEIYIR
ncbi:unnamed protein product [Clonostachys chloroleuca]|uniref:Uncharacterized protein n=1 Tax=Clonostachys chloroleuca TaxID=1926264 RepID=A0AA35MFM4_9HYPO|nr:unnamed protein product [Clonostachys chloroleuca]